MILHKIMVYSGRTEGEDHHLHRVSSRKHLGRIHSQKWATGLETHFSRIEEHRSDHHTEWPDLLIIHKKATSPVYASNKSRALCSDTRHSNVESVGTCWVAVFWFRNSPRKSMAVSTWLCLIQGNEQTPHPTCFLRNWGTPKQSKNGIYSMFQTSENTPPNKASWN